MWKDDAWLLDILLAARRVQDFTRNTQEQEFLRNELVQNAVMRQLEIIGEAARKVSPETAQRSSRSLRSVRPIPPW